ncbi:MAG: hypothetical protein MJ106_01935 [Lentisphaeria bacterium]|nr:hypothetical protein [Lentisphaeria bacterium]
MGTSTEALPPSGELTQLRILILTILLCAAAARCADFNLENIENLELKGFQTNGVSLKSDGTDTEEITWLIQGASAQLQRPNYTLNGFKLQLDGEEDGMGHYCLESPKCIYNKDLQEVRGDSAVSLSGPNGFSITGIGYDFYIDADDNNMRLVIRDAVHITFNLSSQQEWRNKQKRDNTNFTP